MSDVFTKLDIAIFIASLIGVMVVGLIAGRKEETAQDYFLAGRQVRWWGVAGSIFGSNVSANHMVGMMGIGFTVGFAQSHFELGAIAGLMLLCYGFLPVYRKLRLFTLSDYLRQRYDERSAVLYALFMIVVMVLIQMVNGLYIGSRSLNVLLGPDTAQVGVRAEIGFGHYVLGVIVLAIVSASYTIFGGLKAVIWTDVIQSVLILLAGIFVAVLVFTQPEIGGWNGMRQLDNEAVQAEVQVADGQQQEVDIGGAHKMRLYLPSDHKELPWTGVLTGLMVLHFYYWGTNQFIVQRALGAASDEDARRGIVCAGFLKLLIPFFAIGGGIAAFYLFQYRMPGVRIDSDAAFTEVVKLVVHPGFGIMGLIAAGLIGAILSSIDSMMNSSATIVTFDVYRRFIQPDASDERLIWVGRLSIVCFVTLAALVAIFVLNPNSTEHFFLQIVDQQSYLVPGLVVAFFLGMFWPRATATSAFVTMLVGPLFAILLNSLYNNAVENYLQPDQTLAANAPAIFTTFGSQLNTFHRVSVNVVFCVIVQITLSLFTTQSEKKSHLTWTELGGHDPRALQYFAGRLLASLAWFGVLAGAMTYIGFPSTYAAVLAAVWTIGLGAYYAVEASKAETATGEQPAVTLMQILWQDRFWAGILCGVAVFMMFYF
jgi:SSS family solute:Na+ symporter